MHVLIAAQPEYRWTLWVREANAWSVRLAKSNRLRPVVDEALDIAFAPNATVDLTFSTRPVEAVTADLIELPEQLATHALGCDVKVLCREGRLATQEDRWAEVRRFHNRPDVWSMGKDSVFRPQTLRARVEGWFESQGSQTFGPPRPHRNEAIAPHYPRELLVRHGVEDGWLARRICPGSFPKIQPWPTQNTQTVAR